MFVEQVICTNAQWSLSIKLNSVYKVNADNSYAVYHPPLSEGKVLVITTDGNGFVKSCNCEENLSAGDILIFSPENKDFHYHTIGNVWNFWWFEFSGDLTFTQQKFSLYSNNNLLRLCRECSDSANVGDYKTASLILSAIITEIELCTKQIKNTDAQFALFNKATKTVSQNLSTINVSELSSMLKISERTLHSLFVANAGLSPKQYILNLKFNTACFLLKNTNKSVGEISEILGFSSPFHFSRFFTERSSISPANWRKTKIG